MITLLLQFQERNDETGIHVEVECRVGYKKGFTLCEAITGADFYEKIVDHIDKNIHQSTIHETPFQCN